MSKDERLRLDEALVAAGLAPSRSRARDMVKRGTVAVDGAVETRPARRVDAGETLSVDDAAARYVSRSALKLIAGLDAFGFDPTGLAALDLGASTGGFTQVLLERGAAHVIAIDVGRGQLDASLRDDPRVTSLEGLNARDLTRSHVGNRSIGAIVADLSFISLRLALPPALSLAAPNAWGVFLVKPQFEVGREHVGKDGIVRDAQAARQAAEDIATWLEELRFDLAPTVSIPLPTGERSAERSGLRRRAAPASGGRVRGSTASAPSPAACLTACGDLSPLGRGTARNSDAVRPPSSETSDGQAATPTGSAFWKFVGLIASPIKGGDGNQEFLLGARCA